jgi:hypothetical protein
VLFNSIAEMSAYLTVLFLDRFGRKPLGAGMMLLSGIACAARSLLAGVEFRAVRMECGLRWGSSA